jgi:hypothetical protein
VHQPESAKFPNVDPQDGKAVTIGRNRRRNVPINVAGNSRRTECVVVLRLVLLPEKRKRSRLQGGVLGLPTNGEHTYS